MSFTEKHPIMDAVIDAVVTVSVVAIAIGIQVGVSVSVYHWLDRPDRYVDGRWFTVGCVALWAIINAVNDPYNRK